MAKNEVVRIGDLIMWVGRDGVRYFGKVISFTYRDAPIARKIKGGPKPRYGTGREVPDNWTVIATRDAETVNQVHPITRARMDYELLEGTRRYPF